MNILLRATPCVIDACYWVDKTTEPYRATFQEKVVNVVYDILLNAVPYTIDACCLVDERYLAYREKAKQEKMVALEKAIKIPSARVLPKDRRHLFYKLPVSVTAYIFEFNDEQAHFKLSDVDRAFHAIVRDHTSHTYVQGIYREYQVEPQMDKFNRRWNAESRVRAIEELREANRLVKGLKINPKFFKETVSRREQFYNVLFVSFYNVLFVSSHIFRFICFKPREDLNHVVENGLRLVRDPQQFSPEELEKIRKWMSGFVEYKVQMSLIFRMTRNISLFEIKKIFDLCLDQRIPLDKKKVVIQNLTQCRYKYFEYDLGEARRFLESPGDAYLQDFVFKQMEFKMKFYRYKLRPDSLVKETKVGMLDPTREKYAELFYGPIEKGRYDYGWSTEATVQVLVKMGALVSYRPGFDSSKPAEQEEPAIELPAKK